MNEKKSDNKINLDDIFGDIESLIDSGGPSNLGGITIWVPIEYKQKYSHIQAITKRKFSKKVQELLIKSLDKINI